MQTGNGKFMHRQKSSWQGLCAAALMAVCVSGAAVAADAVSPPPSVTDSKGASGSGSGMRPAPFSSRNDVPFGRSDDRFRGGSSNGRTGLDCPYGAGTLAVPCRNRAPDRPLITPGYHHHPGGRTFGRRGYGSFCREVVAEDCARTATGMRCRPRRVVICE
jgi:hypothetical protein